MQKRADPTSQQDNSDMIDKSISFDRRDMHKSWPMVKGCMLLIGAVTGFAFLSIFVFKNFKNWF
jgi:hypothetical protein